MTDINQIEQLFKTHYARLHKVAIALLHDEDVARDMVHDVFEALIYNNPDTLKSESYLIRAVRNRCLNHIRNCSIHQRIINRFFLEDEEYDADDWPDEETMATINRLITDDLSPMAKKVMELRFNNGFQFAKIAAELGISETAVYKHLRNALTIIRKKLNKDG